MKSWPKTSWSFFTSRKRRGRKVWSTVHAFRGFLAVLWTTTQYAHHSVMRHNQSSVIRCRSSGAPFAISFRKTENLGIFQISPFRPSKARKRCSCTQEPLFCYHPLRKIYLWFFPVWRFPLKMSFLENCTRILFSRRCKFTAAMFWKSIMKKDLFVSERFLEKSVEKYPLLPIATQVCGEERNEGEGESENGSFCSR